MLWEFQLTGFGQTELSNVCRERKEEMKKGMRKREERKGEGTKKEENGKERSGKRGRRGGGKKGRKRDKKKSKVLNVSVNYGAPYDGFKCNFPLWTPLHLLSTNMRQLDCVKWLHHILLWTRLPNLNHFVGNFTKFSRYMVHVKTLAVSIHKARPRHSAKQVGSNWSRHAAGTTSKGVHDQG